MKSKTKKKSSTSTSMAVVTGVTLDPVSDGNGSSSHSRRSSRSSRSVKWTLGKAVLKVDVTPELKGRMQDAANKLDMTLVDATTAALELWLDKFG